MADEDQVFFLNGQLQFLNLTLVNPYSGETIEIHEQKNVNKAQYHGTQTGIDTIFFTSLGDALFITDANGNQTISNIDTIFAGDGGDIIALAHGTISLNDMYIFGGNDDDLIWANAGNDYIYAGGGNDIVDGGWGNDYIAGGDGNDVLRGGDGDDIIEGENDNDILYGGAGSNLLSGGAGNDILYYAADEAWPGGFVAWNVGSPDAIIDGDRIVVNPRDRSYDAFDGGDGIDKLILDDESNALFLDDMYTNNPLGYNTARIIGVEIIEARGGDDIVDLTSMQFSYGDVAIHGGDGNDVLWSSAGEDKLYGDAGNDHLDGGSGNDLLVGGAGNDKMFGRGGNDTFIIGEGADLIYGGAGSDTIIYDMIDGLKDTIADFNINAGGDILDISQILEGYDPLSDLISDFVHATSSGGKTTIAVNADGDVGGVFTQIVELSNVTVDLETLINNGHLLV